MLHTADMRVVVVGGGPTGLAASVGAAAAGHDVVLIERSHQWGGMAASLEVSGQRVDLGSHRLHPAASDRVMGQLRDLLGDDLQTRTRNGRILIGGRWVRFPLSPVDMAKHLPPAFVAAAVRDTLLSPFRTPQADTYAEVVRAGLGPATLEWFYGPFARKLWGRSADDLHGEIARRRIAVSSPRRLIAKLVKARREGPPVFLYPKHGYGQVVDELVAAATSAGVELLEGASVQRVDPGAPAELVVDVDGDERRLTADRVFWTAAPHHLAAVVPGSPELHEPTHRAMVLAFLTLDVDRFTPFDAHYLPGLDLLAARVSEPKNYRDGEDPAGQTVLCAEIVCDPGDDIWTADPAALGQRVLHELLEAGIRDDDASAPRLVDVTVERLPAVYPVIGPDDLEPLRELTEWSQSLDGIAVFGRQGLVVADNLHHVLDMAADAVACLADETSSMQWNAERWAEALVRFDQHVVED